MDGKDILASQLKWIVIAFCFTAIVITCILVFGKQGGFKSNVHEPKVGKYVYMDVFEIVHIDRECKQLNKTRRSSRISVSSIPLDASYCPLCVDDNSYEKINIAIRSGFNE